ncbi:hypothetical protein ACIBU0_29745 [Streptomyces sp. NPDC049627]|uniref:hypothetical protein n=1 Tax=Streptomyces sp. NPDC049627 TaxID=3365595 RepID=UPI00379B6358
MHRTTTTATLLVTVAVSALSGCVTIQQTPPPGPPAPSQPPAPPPSEPAERPVVQAPAQEALTLITPSRRPTPTPPTTRPPAPEPPARHAHPHARPEHHEPRRPAVAPPKRPQVKVPDAPRPIRPETPTNGDVCALGRQYGGWKADSPESKICDQTYGR